MIDLYYKKKNSKYIFKIFQMILYNLFLIHDTYIMGKKIINIINLHNKY